MATTRVDDEREPGQSPRLRRRGLIAGAAALVAGLAAKQATEPEGVGANNGDFLKLGDLFTTNNTTTGTGSTGLYFNSTLVPLNRGILIVSNSNSANGSAPTAILGVAAPGGMMKDGVEGITQVDGGYGVHARDETGYAGSQALHAFSTIGTGIVGDTQGSYGIVGRSQAAGGVGISGVCDGPNGYGVIGTVTTGYGVLGQATGGNGVYGYSSGSHGTIGGTAAAGFGGVFGLTITTGAVGVYGSTVNPATGMNKDTAFAGYMDGNFAVVHGFKSAVVPHKDGSHRLVYCMESPENWFEDFGVAKLVNGKADVKLDADFAAIVQADDYRVFVMPEGDCKGVYVTSKTPTGFAVRELQGGTSSVGFSYRLVARRKDITAERLAKVNVPHAAGKTDFTKPSPVPKLPESR